MKLKIGILGTRGIPNHYGGFEQCAEHIARRLSDNGHEVYVYNSHQHPYQKSSWKGVNIIHCYDPEYKLGTIGQFIYDFNCLRNAKKKQFDVLLQLGYTSNAIWFPLWPSSCPNVVNMDGLEWKRSKYRKLVKKFLRFSERLAARKADVLIADSIGIQKYLKNKYQLSSTFIPYGSKAFTKGDAANLPEGIVPLQYDLLIARMEKENNIECILKAFLKSRTKKKLVVIGNYKINSYGTYIHQKYANKKNILFLGGIFNIEILNNLRYHSHLYYHGHTVGGTNPSLIEAMASCAMIIAHNNEFNAQVLNEDACYFSSEKELIEIIQTQEELPKNAIVIENNLKKIEETYNWDSVTEQYERTLLKAVEEFQSSYYNSSKSQEIQLTKP